MSRRWKAPGAALALALAGCGGGGGAAGTATDRTASAPRAGGMGVEQARAFLAGHPEALLLDVREPAEWNDRYGHLDGSIQIPVGQLPDRLDEIADWKEKPVIAICTVGARSGQAARFLAARGFTEVYNLEGGLAAWRRAGY